MEGTKTAHHAPCFAQSSRKPANSAQTPRPLPAAWNSILNRKDNILCPLP